MDTQKTSKRLATSGIFIKDSYIYKGHIKYIQMDNNNPIEYNRQNKELWNKFGFFKGDQHIVYVFNKTEKISSALYIVSGLLKDSEPLKWELREKAVMLLSTALSLNSVEPVDRGSLIQTIFATFLETTTLLSVAQIGGLISPMNYEILVREINSLVALVRSRIEEDESRAGYVLSDAFFKTDDPAMDASKVVSMRIPFAQNEGPKKAQNSTQSGSVDSAKAARQEQIISVLRTGSNLTIKDFTKVVVGCSEKTIQRELIDLVNKGVIVKSGERRWSRYSLKS